MAKRKRKVKDDAWIVGLVGIIIALALITQWWKENAIMAWLIFGLIIIGFGYSLYRFPSLRRLIFKTAKKTGENIVFQEEASSREPIPTNIRQQILARARNRCENQDCKQDIKPHIHHIDANNSNNNPRNLIALCPNCHTKAHGGVYTTSQLRNWANFSWANYQRSRPYRR